MKEQTEVRTLKKGRYVMIDSEPCTIMNISTSKPGKHGGAKARMSAVGIFDNQRRIIVKPADARIDVPIIEKKAYQVIAIIGDNVDAIRVLAATSVVKEESCLLRLPKSMRL